jgi:hypothetical protein
MSKSLFAAAALAALAFGSAGSANAAVANAGFDGIRAPVHSQLIQKAHDDNDRRWHKHRKHKHCVWRHHHRVCWWS